MSNADKLREVLTNKELASLGDAFVNFIYSLALTEVSGRPRATKVSDKTLAEAFRAAGLREFLGSRITKKDLADASESLLMEAYNRGLLTIDESVKLLAQDPEGLSSGLMELLKVAAHRVSSD